MKISLLILPLVVLSLALPGCRTFREGVSQNVVILSFPNEASVYINGQPIGITPLETSLPRKLNHEIRLEKYGYNTAVKYITPEWNERGRSLIRFGLMEDLGLYYDLRPSPLKAVLQSELVPTSTGTDPFEKLAQQALAADAKLEAGEITPEEHKAIIEQILSFFDAE